MLIAVAIIALVLASPTIAHQLRRIVVSIASELKMAKDELAALKDQVAAIPSASVDLTGIEQSITDLTQKVSDLSALVGTSAELNP